MTAQISRTEPVAAIDVGTNTTLLLVAVRETAGELVVIEDACETTRLGQGLAASGSLQPEAVERTLECLERFARRARECGVSDDRLRVVSTAVLRRASDASQFVDLARDRLSLEVEVLGEREEARLGYAAVSRASGRSDVVVVDVGGGSTEVVLDGGRSRTSAPFGALVGTEGYLGMGGRSPRFPGGLPALERAIRAAFEVFPEGGARESGAVLLGGTGANLACLGMQAEGFDPERVEGYRVATAQAGEWARRLQGMSLEQRLHLPIEEDRAEILPAGFLCVALAAQRIGARELMVSGRGLRFGVAMELLDGAARLRP